MESASRSRSGPAGAVIAGVVLLYGSVLPSAMAQDGIRAAQPRAVEEIIVQARQRTETLQEVPIAVSALGSESIERLALNDLTEVSAFVPNLNVSYGSSGASSQVFLRGIGTGSGSAGFSSAVGLLIDGVYYERGRWIQQGYFDLEQIEVLKGPQALYFGKNNSAGLVVLRTRNPGPEFEANARVGYEADAGEALVEGGVSIPLTPELGVRLAGRVMRQDGWMKNTSQPQTGVDPLGFDIPGARGQKDLPGIEETLGRLTVSWTPTDRFEALVKASYARNEDHGVVSRSPLVQCFGPDGGAQEVFGVPSPFDDCRKNFRQSKSNHAPELFAPEPDEFGDGTNYTDYRARTLSAQLSYDFDSFTVHSNTGYQRYKVDSVENYTFSDDGQVPGYEDTDWKAWSQEFRIVSDFDHPLNFLAGLVYTDTDLFFRNASRVAPLPADSTTGRLWSWDKPATEEGESWSVYGELLWDITPELELATGARYTREKKDSEITPVYVHEILVALGALSDQPFENRFKDSNVSPQATLTWRPNRELTLFTAYREGFKSGGFDLSFLLGAGSTLDDLVFESETAKGFEVGAKALLLDGRLGVNAVAYRYVFDDLQVQQYNAETTQFTIDNAAEARTTGIEVDFTWMVDDRLSLRGALAYNVAEYQEFLAACYAGQSVEAGCAADYDPLTDRFRTQDMSGRDLNLAPRWAGLMGISYDFPVGSRGWQASLNLDSRFSSSYTTSTSEIPGTKQSAFAAFDSTVSLFTPDERWEVSLIARNLTDRKISVYSADRPLTGGASGVAEGDPRLGGRADAYARIERGRQLWLQATFRM